MVIYLLALSLTTKVYIVILFLPSFSFLDKVMYFTYTYNL